MGSPDTGLQQARDFFWDGYLCLRPSKNINFEDKGGFCLFVFQIKKKEEGKRSKQTHDTGTLNFAPIFKLCFWGAYLH